MAKSYTTLRDTIRAFPPPDTLPILSDRNRSIFQRNIKPDILVHGCLPFDAGPGSKREPVFPSYRGQPPMSDIAEAMPLGEPSRDYPMFKNSSAHDPKTKKEKNRNLTPTPDPKHT
jgi:hypothetical protein